MLASNWMRDSKHICKLHTQYIHKIRSTYICRHYIHPTSLPPPAATTYIRLRCHLRPPLHTSDFAATSGLHYIHPPLLNHPPPFRIILIVGGVRAFALRLHRGDAALNSSFGNKTFYKDRHSIFSPIFSNFAQLHLICILGLENRLRISSPILGLENRLLLPLILLELFKPSTTHAKSIIWRLELLKPSTAHAKPIIRRMDKSWIALQRKSDVYLCGIEAFLEFAFRDRPSDSLICCPCEKCMHRYFKSRRDVRDHCFFNGFSLNYKNWTCHGKLYEPIHTHDRSRLESERGDDMIRLVYEAMGTQNAHGDAGDNTQSTENDHLNGADEDTLKFYQLLEDASRELGKDIMLDTCDICGTSRYKECDRKIAVKKMRHPSDSLAWKDFDEKNNNFSIDSRNVRLGLAADGFSPFKLMNVSHSSWPVVLIPYNLPPWICMGKDNFLLSMLIDGPKGPSNKIDVYLQPLIEELKELWENGVETYDISRNERFSLKAALMWTISDLPGYSMLSGWGTKTDRGCPCCGMETMCRRLQFAHKYSYTYHRRFLSRSHRFRRDTTSFDGTMEWGVAPKRLSGIDVLQQLDSNGVITEYKKEDLKKRFVGDYNVDNHRYWKRRSIFFELPYWKFNIIRHNLDVMHIEKNVCDNVIFTLLNVKGKTKDNLNARHELAKLGVRKPLHAFKRRSGRWCLPPGPCNMGLNEKDIFCKVLKSIRAPNGYASNISKCVQIEKRTIWGLKSHDNHVLMQNLLSVAVRKALPKHVVEVLIELSTFSGSSVPRFLMTLKKYMRNKAHPEGSIAKGYILEECMIFCSRYLNNVETNANKHPHNHDEDNSNGRLIGNGKEFHLDHVTWVQAHRYVLQNSDVVKIYRDGFRRVNIKEIERLHHEKFHEWFKGYIENLRISSGDTLPEDIITLSRGPSDWGKRHNACVVHGFRFRVKSLNARKKTQNSGVICSASTSCYASSKDKRPQTGVVHYYGVLTDIIQIHYSSNLRDNLFKCDWINNEKGLKIDQFKFTLVNFNHVMYTGREYSDEPYILSTQAEQVWYVDDPLESNWKVFMKMNRRDNFDVYSSERQTEMHASIELDDHPIFDDGNWVREGAEAVEVDDNDNENGNTTNTSVCLKKGRGRSKPIARWNPETKLQLEIIAKGEVDEPDRVEFQTQIGVMARNSYRFPLIYTSFDQMPQRIIEDHWSEIKDRTILPDEAKSSIIENFGRKWKQGKHEIKKKYFKRHEDDEERLVEVTTNVVPPEQLKLMMEYWKLDKTKLETERNTKNIPQYKFQHWLGRLPLSELTKQQLLSQGTEPCRIDKFCMSCAPNGKPPVNQDTANLITQIRESISRVPEAERTRELEETIWTEFMGTNGHCRVRCEGQGDKPSRYRQTLSSFDIMKKKIREEVTQEVKEGIREENEQMRVEREQMRNEILEMRKERE
ncbi:hypothetical protein BUALT_Bualt19G0049100 [Buddleja alternifolia]|uniref:Transposase-associated domain-containing protein n=1 Tax=Buddleja alternifolia TaxID=168488 RepID=A0AAV6W7H7_9LAMI|nr:hypothetical protein BUALT_Bualt19G0049100 [Buddleja alternifolia]